MGGSLSPGDLLGMNRAPAGRCAKTASAGMAPGVDKESRVPGRGRG
jgi:hypothetical protein